MKEFDPLKVNSYTILELADMIDNEVVTIDTLYYTCGLAAGKRPPLEEELRKRKQVVDDDEGYWKRVSQERTVAGYKRYLRKYDKTSPDYKGRHVMDAKYQIDILEEEYESLRNELFKAMRNTPWIFKQDGMKMLLNGITDSEQLRNLRTTGDTTGDITSRFLASGQKITREDLVNEGILPSNFRIETITRSDINLRQTNMDELGDFPEESRTDVYFFGVPRGGKSSVLAGLLSSMDKRGVAVYQPHYNNDNRDLVRDYYYDLIEATRVGKFPVSTGADTVNFMKFDLTINKRKNPLTFVELGGEAFRHAAETGLRGAAAWDNFGAGSCLRSKNHKLLLFILDYSLTQGINQMSSESDQKKILNTALDILSTDGKGESGSVGCTLSKVDSVAIIVTKADLMGCEDRVKRNELSFRYIEENFASFMLSLKTKCQRFDINKAVNYEPYIMAFSLGKLLVGNTYDYDSTDSDRLVEFISDVTSGQNTSLWGRLFGK